MTITLKYKPLPKNLEKKRAYKMQTINIINKEASLLFNCYEQFEKDPKFASFHNEFRLALNLNTYYDTMILDYRNQKRIQKQISFKYQNRMYVKTEDGYVSRDLSKEEIGFIFIGLYQEYNALYNKMSLNILKDKDAINIKDMFDKMFKEITTTQTSSIINKNFQQIVASFYTKDGIYYDENFINYMLKGFIMIFKRNQHKTKGKSAISRSNLSYELGLMVVSFIIFKLDNTKLNNLLHELTDDAYYKISENNLRIVKALYEDALAENEVSESNKTQEKKERFYSKMPTLFKEYFTYTDKKLKKEVSIDSIYVKILGLYLKDLVCGLLNDFSNTASIFKINNVNNDILYNIKKEYRTRVVQYGNLIIDSAITNNLCYAKMVYYKATTMSMIYLTEKTSIPSLQDLFQYKKPQILVHPISLKDIEHLYTRYFKKKIDTAVSTLWLLEIKDLKHRIHRNADMALSIIPGKSSYKYFPRIKYTINHKMLRLFLLELETLRHPLLDYTPTFESLTIMTSTNTDYDNILMLYNFSLSQLKILLSKYPDIPQNKHFHRSLFYLVDYMLDFSSSEQKPIEEKLLGRTMFNGKEVIKGLFDKVFQYKIFIVGLIRDAIIYAKFGYFIANSFLDSRGRLYNREVYLNIQNNPLAKMFVGLYKDPKRKKLNMNSWGIIKNVIKHYETNKSFLEESLIVDDTSDRHRFNELKANNFTLVTQDILNDFDSEKLQKVINDLQVMHGELIQKENLSHFIFDISKQPLKNQLSILRRIIKKKRQLWTVLHKIQKYSINALQVIELDANNSGSQMISILLSDPTFARDCNLIGDENIDAYMTILTELNDLLSDLHSYMQELNTEYCTFNASLYKKPLTNSLLLHYNQQFKQGTLSKDEFFSILIQLFLHADLRSSTGIKFALNLLAKIYKPSKLCIPHESLYDKVYNLIPKHEITLLESTIGFYAQPEIQSLFKLLLVIRVGFNLNYYYNTYTWLHPTSSIWKERDLFKKPIMTLYYNATRFTRVNHFEDFFKDKSQEHKQSITQYSFSYLAQFIETFFVLFAQKNLTGNRSMLMLTSFLSKKNTPITINNGFFNITIYPRYKNAISVESKTLQNKRQQLAIRIPTSTLNKNKVKVTLTPNIIHSMDAFIVHKFIEKIAAINDALSVNHNSFEITYYINHDNFACNVPYLLPIIIKECYHDLMKTDYLTFIKELTDEERKGLHVTSAESFAALFCQKANPRFIK